MKLTVEEFKELQRWIYVRDYIENAKNLILNAKILANVHNYDREEAKRVDKFLTDLREKAIDKTEKFIDIYEEV